MRPVRLIAATLPALVYFLGTAAAQAQSSTLIGTVADAITHEPLSGVLVAVRGADARNAVTDDGGNYRIPDLAPGTYTVQSTKAGYHTFIRPGVPVRPNRTLRINTELLTTTPIEDQPSAGSRDRD